jgi:uncharacterized delta-60 repeat protein
MKKNILAILVFITFINVIYSQPAPPVAWIKAHNGNNLYDEAVAMKVDAAGNSYVTGRCNINGTEDYCTIKYNSAGAQQWIAYYNGTQNISDRPTDIDIDPQGNIYVTGYVNYSTQDPFNSGDYCTIKYDANGVQQWAQIFFTQVNKKDLAQSIAVDASGNVFVTGSSWFSSSRADDMVTIKYNSQGQVLWTGIYDGNGEVPESDGGKEIFVDSQGNAYVIGSCTNLLTGIDFVMVKYTPQGVQQFIAFYAGPQNTISESGTAITVDNSGNIYAAGSSDNANTDIVTIKYAPSGVMQWTRIYDGGGIDDVTDIAADNSGNVYVSGKKGVKGLVIKYNAGGNLMWEKEISGTGGNEVISNLIIDPHGDVYGTGKIAAGTDFNFVTVKIDPAGIIQWQAIHNGSGNQNDFGNAIGIDGAGNIYVTGSSVESGQNGNFCTIKYAPGTIGINPVSGEIPDNFMLSQNYPNPFNPVTNIKFGIPKAGNVRLIIYDINGREVNRLINQNLNAGYYTADFNASNLASGVYFYRLEANDFTDVKKMMLVK